MSVLIVLLLNTIKFMDNLYIVIINVKSDLCLILLHTESNLA